MKVRAPPPGTPRGTPEEEATRGEVNYRKVLKRLHEELQPSLYLEIGVRFGLSLELATGPAIGVDPAPAIDVELPPSTKVVSTTSDEFFAECGDDLSPELVFIDGMHLFEFALRDFINAERRMPSHGLIVIDDVFPNHVKQASRERQTGAWTGDVWKLAEIIGRYRPDLDRLTLNTAPTGLLLLTSLDSTDRTLEQHYGSILEEYQQPIQPPGAVLERQGAASPNGPELTSLFEQILNIKRADGH